jgi:hypothetical protein
MPPELKQLLLRFCQLGRLLPRRDEIDSIADFDGSELAGIELVLREMVQVKGAIDEFLAAARAEKAPTSARWADKERPPAGGTSAARAKEGESNRKSSLPHSRGFPPCCRSVSPILNSKP